MKKGNEVLDFDSLQALFGKREVFPMSHEVALEMLERDNFIELIEDPGDQLEAMSSLMTHVVACGTCTEVVKGKLEIK